MCLCLVLTSGFDSIKIERFRIQFGSCKVTNRPHVDRCVLEVGAHSEVDHGHLHYRVGLKYHIVNLNIGEEIVYYAPLIKG